MLPRENNKQVIPFPIRKGIGNRVSSRISGSESARSCTLSEAASTPAEAGRVLNMEVDSSSTAQMELLLGTIGLMAEQGDDWVTWVQPSSVICASVQEHSSSLKGVRVLHRDRQRSAFHLLYLAVQAANSSWVVGPTQELSFSQIEILEQAARQHGCTLLLVRELNTPAVH